jgi:hypothetical protein
VFIQDVALGTYQTEGFRSPCPSNSEHDDLQDKDGEEDANLDHRRDQVAE